MYVSEQLSSKEFMLLKKSIRLPLHDATQKASLNRRRLAIPET